MIKNNPKLKIISISLSGEDTKLLTMPAKRGKMKINIIATKYHLPKIVFVFRNFPCLTSITSSITCCSLL